jgi:tryptophanase
MRTIIEPFKIKAVEPIRMTTREERAVFLRKAGYNLFLLDAEDVLIDLLTDSGTSAMSAAQWAGIMQGDESYAGARSWKRFEAAVKDIFGFRHVIPTHQGRAAERILFQVMAKSGDRIPNNSFFDTTRANAEFVGAKAVDLVIDEARDTQSTHPFKGNIDLARLARFLDETPRELVPLGMLTITNNTGGGQPVSMENIRETARLLHSRGIPFYIDACRFAENAWFIRQREPGYAHRHPIDIAREMFSHADGCTMSAKKDGMANIGGFLATNDDEVARRERDVLILTEGFPTYGGLAGRDLDAVAIGLYEALDEAYLHYRIRSTAYLGEHISAAGVPIMQPPGGHAVYIDAAKFLPHIPPHGYPGAALAAALYLHAGIRSVEIGTVMFGRPGEDGRDIPAPLELVRLAIPRRVYTQSHIDYVVEAIIEVFQRREAIGGLRMTWQPPYLRHFTCRFEPLAPDVFPA